MEHNIFLTNSKAEHFDFDLEIKGLSGQDVDVRLVLHSDPFCMMFPAKSLGEGKWTLEFPPMPFLEATTYKFVIEAVVDGYYFPAHEGTMTVSKSPEVYVKKDDATMKVRNKKVTVADAEPATKPEKETVKPASTPATEPPAMGDDKFKEIIDRLKKTPAENPDEKKEEVKEAKKPEPKKPEVKKTVKEDPLAAAKKAADKILTEAPTAKAPAKKKAASKKADNDKVRQIIAETQQQQKERKEREAQRKQRLNEAAAAKKKAESKSEPKKVVEAGPTEKDLAAKAILESAQAPEVEKPKKKAIFKKGDTVTK